MRATCTMIRRRAAALAASVLAVTMLDVVALPLVPHSPVAAPTAAALPAEFAQTTVGSVSGPTAIEQLPDGRVVVLQQGGQVRIVQNGVVQPGTALSLSVCSGGERGLLGFTADPDITTNGFVYLYYTRTASESPGGCVNRVSRFTLSGSTISPASEVVLIDNISSVNGNHNGGDLFVGADGFLYVGVGDAGRDPRGNSGSAGGNDAAQDLSLLNGKILRINRFTGEAPADNPLVGQGAVACATRGNTPSTPTTPCAELYAWGLRNPWRIVLDPNVPASFVPDPYSAPQRFFINDVGQGTREEVDLGAKGANYGWNSREGQCPAGQNPPCAGPPAGITDPITDYARANGRSFITAGAFVPNGVWPEAYDGGYLFADGGSGEIWLRTAAGTVDYATPFATGAGGIADMAFVRENGISSVWYVVAGTSSNNIRRISWAPAPPAASGPLAFVPTTSTRLLDTRDPSTGGRSITAGTTRYVDTGLDGSVTRAVLVSIALVAPTRDGFLTAWAGRSPQPTTANANAVAGEVVSNMSVVPLDSGGGMLLYAYSNTNVVVDLLGRFDNAPGAVAAGRFLPVTPSRLADTREAASSTNRYTRLTGSPYPKVNVPILGRGAVPSSGVSSVVLVVTGLSDASPAGGFLTATPGGGAWPGTANLTTNGSGDIRPNTVVVPVGADGSIDLHLFQVADVVVDVAGWFTDASVGAATTGRFVSIPPTREVDTRIDQSFGRMPARAIGWVDPGSVPNDAVAIAQNIAITDNAAPGYITPFPGGAVPFVAAGNVTAPGQTRSIHTFTRLGGDGRESYFAYMDTDLVVDITGWFTP